MFNLLNPKNGFVAIDLENDEGKKGISIKILMERFDATVISFF